MPARSRSPAPPLIPETKPDRSSWWAPLVLVAAVSAAYSNSFHGEFIFDDGSSIERNESIRSLWPLTDVLRPGVEGGRTIDGRPLVNLSLAVNYAISGLNVESYHVFNLAIHIGAVLLLFGLVRRTLLLPGLRDRLGPHATGLAFAVALVWGLHPLNTESVTYVVQRAESLMGLFYLATLYCVARGEMSQRPRVWWVAAFLACLAGMATKEVMVTAPVVATLYLWVFVFGSLRDVWRQRWPLLVALASTWPLLAVLVVASGGRGGSVDLDAPLSPARYAALQLAAVVHYLKLSFVPRPLVLDYGRHIAASAMRVALCGSVVLALAAGTLWALARRPWIGFLGSAFFLILLPSSSVVPIITQVMAEHRMYLPLAAVASLVVFAGFEGWQRLKAQSRPLPRWAPAALVALIGLSLGLQTWIRNLDYRTGISIWTDAAEKQPLNPRAHSQLATLYMAAGDFPRSLEHLDRTIELKPTDTGAHFVRGALHLRLESFESAMHDFDRCVQLNPNYAEAYQNRGLARLKLNQPQQAASDFTRAIELGPQLVGSYRYRASAWWALNRVVEAQLDAREYLRRRGTLDDELQRILAADRSE